MWNTSVIDIDPRHLCCETRLTERRRWAGNFPQCDSPPLFRKGACAQNQERKKERENETERGDGRRSRKYLVREEREVQTQPVWTESKG